jgi:hypothetical protein
MIYKLDITYPAFGTPLLKERGNKIKIRAGQKGMVCLPCTVIATPLVKESGAEGGVSYLKFNCLSFLDKFDWAMPIAAAVAVIFPSCLARTAPK